MKKLKSLFIIVGGASLLSGILAWLFRTHPMMPARASVEAVLVDHAFNAILWLSIPIYSLVIVSLVYALIVFRSTNPGEEGEKFDRSRHHWVESLWIGVSLVITLGLAWFGTVELKQLRSGQGTADLDININASQFSWEFFYPAQNFYGSRLLLPVNKKARLIFKSADVIHSFWVPEFRLKRDVVPGRISEMVITPTVKGSYQLRCSELCGSEHTDMVAWVDVLDEDEFNERLEESW